MKYAVIDIGSNSVRLLLWADGHTLCKKVNTTRLAEGLTFTGKLSREAMERTAAAIAGFGGGSRTRRRRKAVRIRHGGGAEQQKRR